MLDTPFEITPPTFNLRPTRDFGPSPEPRPDGASSPGMQFLRDNQGRRWLAKCSGVALYGPNILAEAQVHPNFMGQYVDELLEILGLFFYQQLGRDKLRVPDTTLTYQIAVASPDHCRQYEYDRTPRLHVASRWIEGNETLHHFCDYFPPPADFLTYYREHARRSEGYCRILINGEELELRGLGAALAIGDLLEDVDCWGNYYGNVAFVVQEDRNRQRYLQLVKLDGAYSCSYYAARFDEPHDPSNRHIRIAPRDAVGIDFADLTTADRREFSEVAQRILAVSDVVFEACFNAISDRVLGLGQGILRHHCQGLYEGLIARRRLFLRAFGPETDDALTYEVARRHIILAGIVEDIGDIPLGAICTDQRAHEEAQGILRTRLTGLRTEPYLGAGEPYVFQLPPRLETFIDCAEASQLTQLEQNLRFAQGSVITQGITGLGGVGKTQLALELAHISYVRRQYAHIIWFHAEAYVGGQFQVLAEKLCGQNGLRVEEATAAVYRFLHGRATLIVFDNAINLGELQVFLPPENYNSHLHLIITSRNPYWDRIPAVNLSGFTLAETKNFITRHLGETDEILVTRIHHLLGGLPLAISQVVSYVMQRRYSLAEYPTLFYLCCDDLFNRELLTDNPHLCAVGTTMTLSLAHAQRTLPSTERVLSFTAYFAAENIPIPLMVKCLELPEDKVDQVLDACQILREHSLISFTNKNNDPEEPDFQISVHRLVQETLRYRHRRRHESVDLFIRAVRYLTDFLTYDVMDLDAIDDANEYVPHAVACVALERQVGLPPEHEITFARLLFRLGYHYQQGVLIYNKAKEVFERALRIQENYYYRGHAELLLEMSKTRLHLANACGALGDHLRQKQLLEETYRLLVRPDEMYIPEIARLLANIFCSLGSSCYFLGDNDESKDYFQRSIRVGENLLRIERRPTIMRTLANALTGLSNVYGILGKSNEQKGLLENVLALQLKYCDYQHPDVARTLTVLGDTHRMLRQNAEAIFLLQNACNIKQRFYGNAHPEVAAPVVCLAIAYLETEPRYAPHSKNLLQYALDIYHTLYGGTHPNIANTLYHLTFACLALREFPAAQRHARNALEIFQKHFGTTHPSTQKAQQLIRTCEEAFYVATHPPQVFFPIGQPIVPVMFYPMMIAPAMEMIYPFERRRKTRRRDRSELPGPIEMLHSRHPGPIAAPPIPAPPENPPTPSEGFFENLWNRLPRMRDLLQGPVGFASSVIGGVFGRKR